MSDQIRKKKTNKLGIILILGIAFIVGVTVTVCLRTRQHEYYCDKFLFHADSRDIDLQELHPDIISVVELLPVTNEKLTIVCRVDESTNLLMIYDFKNKEFVFEEYGTQFAWIQDDYDSVLYLKDDAVYNLKKDLIYQVNDNEHISVIEYIDKDFYVTITDSNYENLNQIYVEY